MYIESNQINITFIIQIIMKKYFILLLFCMLLSVLVILSAGIFSDRFSKTGKT